MKVPYERMGDGLGGRERDILGLKRCLWGQQGWTRTGGSIGSEVETCWARARVRVRHVGPASLALSPLFKHFNRS